MTYSPSKIPTIPKIHFEPPKLRRKPLLITIILNQLNLCRSQNVLYTNTNRAAF